MSKLSYMKKDAKESFMTAVEATRKGSWGVSIEDIAECFFEVFDEDELKALINELKK